MTDADQDTVDARHAQLNNALEQCEMNRRGPQERIGILIPKRNIETWVAKLLGKTVDEDTEKNVCKNLVADSDFKPAAGKYIEFYQDAQKPRGDLLPSIVRSFEELDRVREESRS